jgi:hypothetical protein
MILLRMLTAAVLGFLSSQALYEPLHEKEVPETFRYAAGGCVILCAVPLFENERRSAFEAALLAMAGVGVGVVGSRLLLREHDVS